MGSLAHVILAQTNDKKSSGFPFGILLLPLMFVALYYVMIRPNKRRAAQQAQVQQSVQVGDEILTTSGMYGIVTAMDDEDLWLEVADGIEIRVARGAMMRVTQSAAGAPEGSADET